MAADDLSGALIPGESLEDDGTADHVASKANGTLAILHAHRTVCGETAVAPGEEVVDDRLEDQLLVQQPPQHLATEKPLDVPGVEPDERLEGAVGSEAPVCHKHMDMRVEVEQLAQKLPVVAEEHSQPLGDREDHLAVGNILEQLLVGPVRPQKLALLVAAWAQAPKLAGEGDEEIVPAVGAAHTGDSLVENAAIEIAVDRWLDAAAQVAVLFLEVLLVDEQEAFEVLRRSSIENRAFGMV